MPYQDHDRPVCHQISLQWLYDTWDHIPNTRTRGQQPPKKEISSHTVTHSVP